MNNFLLRLSLAAALVFSAAVLSGNATAQQPSPQDPAATAQQQSPSASSSDQQVPSAQEPRARPQQEPRAPAANPSQNEQQMPADSDAQTQDARAFTGRVVKENGKVVLKDPVTKTSYQVDDVSKVKGYIGREVEVKVTGRLDMDSNVIHVETVEPMR